MWVCGSSWLLDHRHITDACTLHGSVWALVQAPSPNSNLLLVQTLGVPGSLHTHVQVWTEFLVLSFSLV